MPITEMKRTKNTVTIMNVTLSVDQARELHDIIDYNLKLMLPPPLRNITLLKTRRNYSGSLKKVHHQGYSKPFTMLVLHAPEGIKVTSFHGLSTIIIDYGDNNKVSYGRKDMIAMLRELRALINKGE